MKINFIPFLLLLALLAGSGCSGVSTTRPLPIDHKSDDREKFEGIWKMGDIGLFHVKFSKNGIAQIALLEWKEEEFRMVKGEGTLTEGQKHNFLSIRGKEDDAEGYSFVAYKFIDQGDLVLWLPVPEEFETIIATGQLQVALLKKVNTRKA